MDDVIDLLEVDDRFDEIPLDPEPAQPEPVCLVCQRMLGDPQTDEGTIHYIAHRCSSVFGLSPSSFLVRMRSRNRENLPPDVATNSIVEEAFGRLPITPRTMGSVNHNVNWYAVSIMIQNRQRKIDFLRLTDAEAQALIEAHFKRAE